MARVEYSRYLASAHWKHLRATVIRAAGGCCQQCGTDTGITVHHLTYVRLGHEEPNDLRVLCRACHGALHGRPSDEVRLQGSPEWQELRELVPDLEALERDCFEFQREARRTSRLGESHTAQEATYSLCLAAWYGWRRSDPILLKLEVPFKVRLTALIGWNAKHHPAGIVKQRAYDIAYDHLFHVVLGL